MVIFVVLLASVTMPAMAAPSEILYPSDYLSNYNEQPDGSAHCRFRFETYHGGFYQLYNGNNYVISSFGEFDFTTNYEDYDFYQISWFPLGTNYSRPEASGAVIDISDFQSGIYFNFESSIQLQVQFYSGGSSTAFYYTKSSCTFYWYDENYQFITSTNTAEVTRSWIYGSPTVADRWVIQNSFDLTIPDNARYLVPRVIVKVEDPGPGAIMALKSTANEYFDLTCTKDAVRGNSLTMKAIEENLEELNDKTDTIINGTDDQQHDADRLQGMVQDEDETLFDAIDELQEFQKFDTQSIFGAINDFLEADGWDDIRYLLEPLLQWQYTSTMMLFILAFSTLRILLLGR